MRNQSFPDKKVKLIKNLNLRALSAVNDPDVP
jgi:hypothetical protein